MKHLIFTILSLLIFDALFSRCANPQSPTGGPKDTIPPTVLHSVPLSGTTNFQDQEITIEFSEFVNADNLAQNLIITPKTDVKYKHLVRRNQLVMKFEESFAPNTTYSFNFFDGVTDITEKNPAINLLLAFSTGDFIDSMQVNGKINDLLSQEPSAGFTIGLYPPTDTLDYFTQTPIYFTTSNDSGEFVIPYIKTGNYKLLAFNDDNRNLTLDPETEDHGFTSDTLKLFSDTAQLTIPTLLQNVKPIQLINNRPIGAYHEVRYNKQIHSYALQPDSLYSNQVGDKKDIIRFYNAAQFNFNDSIPVIVQASDSIGNSTTDSLMFVFLESNRKPSALTMTITQLNEVLENNPTYRVRFNKPITSSDPLKIKYVADSLLSFNPDSIRLNWNPTQTEVEIITFLLKDSLLSTYEKTYLETDSLALNLTDSSALSLTDSSALDTSKPAPPPSIQLALLQGTFISVENDSSSTQQIIIKQEVTKTFGTLKLILTTEDPSFEVQLLNNKKEVAYSVRNDTEPTFNVTPGSYTVRVLVDTNNDGKWSFGNLLQNIEPEKVYLFPEEIAIRENWIVEDINISF